jgi:hypothetical protein
LHEKLLREVSSLEIGLRPFSKVPYAALFVIMDVKA